jgi:hypothetical protein
LASRNMFGGLIASQALVLEYKPLNAARECGVTFFLRTGYEPGLCASCIIF